MAHPNIVIAGATYPTVPSITVPKSGGGNAQFYDVGDTTATTTDVLQGKYFYNASGALQQGTVSIVYYYTGSSAPSASLGNDGDIYLQTS